MNLPNLVKWGILAAGAVVMIGCLAANLAALLRFLSTRQQGSMIPLIGGVAGAAALWVAPVAALRQLWWLPLLVEPGTACWLAVHLVGVVRFRVGKR